MKILPQGRREWLRFALLILVFPLLFILTGVYITGMPGRSYSGIFQSLSEDELAIRDNLKDYVLTLAGKIGKRDIEYYEALKASSDFIRSSLQKLGYGVSEQEYTVDGKSVQNLETEIRGKDLSEKIIIVGAHYDSIYGSPGANDNASGVAGVLELARILKTRNLARTVRFVAFVNEEPPFFQTDNMGSRVYVKRLRERGDNVIAMLSLETIGYYSDADKSQFYPFPFSLFYPKNGNFIGFVGNISSRSLVRQAIREFRKTTAFPSEGAAAPDWLTGIGWSDHWSFWQEDYKAVMVTDTALFRYEYYHTVSDTPDKIDYDRMARVVLGLSNVITGLANNNIN